GGRIAPGIEIEQVERAREALDLDAGGLDLRLGQIVEHARADQGHDQPDDGDHHQDFDEPQAGLASPRPAARPAPLLPSHLTFPPSVGLTDDLADRQQSGHHRDYQTTHNETNHNDRRRSRDTDHAIEAALELGLVELGDPAGDHRQLAGLIAEAEHA